MKPEIVNVTTIMQYEDAYVHFPSKLDEFNELNIEFGYPEIDHRFSILSLEELEDFIQRLTELKKLFKPE